MKKLGFIAIAAALLFPTLAHADELKNASKNADVTKVSEANKKISTIQCPFSRTTKVAVIKDAPKPEEGNFYFQTPNNLAMKYTSGEIFIVTEDNVSLTIGGKARTLRSGNHHVEELSNTLLACIKGDLKSIDGTLKSSKVKGNDIIFVIETEMKVGRNSVTSIELAYNKTDYTLTSLKLIEKDGSYTLYELGTKTLNKSIDAKTFEHAKTAKKSSSTSKK